MNRSILALVIAAYVLCIVGTAVRAAPVRQAQRPMFSSNADAVFVDVSVMDGRKPVLGLSATDFAVLDNGKPQVIDDAVIEAKNLDVTVLLDCSGSASYFYQTALAPAVRELAASMHADDKLDVVAFDRRIDRITDATVSRVLVPPLIGDGGTALFDALGAALMRHTDPGERHMVLALTDGIDTHSIISRTMLQSIIGRSNAVVELVAVSFSGRTSGFVGNLGTGQDLELAGDYDYILRDIAESAGGQFYDVRANTLFLPSIKDAIERFRSRYTLKYRPVGVDHAGWHELTVSLTHGRYQVHARKGYAGG